MPRAALLLISLLSLPLAAQAGKDPAGKVPTAHTHARASALPDPAPADDGRALAALADGHPQTAMVLLRRVLAAHPQDDDARLLLGELLLDEGLAVEARPLLQRGFDVRPAGFGLLLARAMLASGDAEAALQILASMPAPPEGAAWRDAMTGAAARAAGQTDRAIDAWRKAVLVRPGQIDWVLALSQCLRTAGRSVEADSVLQDFLDRDRIAAHDGLAEHGPLADRDREAIELERDGVAQLR